MPLRGRGQVGKAARESEDPKPWVLGLRGLSAPEKHLSEATTYKHHPRPPSLLD